VRAALDTIGEGEEGMLPILSIDLALSDGIELVDDSKGILFSESEAIFADIGVHVNWLNHDHAEAGIVRGNQSYRTLVREAAQLDERCAPAFREGLIRLSP
jgi:hypothetical protein